MIRLTPEQVNKRFGSMFKTEKKKNKYGAKKL